MIGDPGCDRAWNDAQRSVTEHVVLAVEEYDVVTEVEVRGVVHAELDQPCVVSRLPLATLHEQPGVRDLAVAAAVVEVEVAAHDDVHLGRIETFAFERRPDAAAGSRSAVNIESRPWSLVGECARSGCSPVSNSTRPSGCSRRYAATGIRNSPDWPLIITPASLVSHPQARDGCAGTARIDVSTYAPLMTERMIKANGVDICTEAFGDPDDTPILLIMGASASMLLWPEEFCEAARRGALRDPLRQP